MTEPITIDGDALMAMIAVPEAADCRICSICAIECGAEWREDLAAEMFETGECPGCGREAPMLKIKDWQFKERHSDV